MAGKAKYRKARVRDAARHVLKNTDPADAIAKLLEHHAMDTYLRDLHRELEADPTTRDERFTRHGWPGRGVEAVIDREADNEYKAAIAEAVEKGKSDAEINGIHRKSREEWLMDLVIPDLAVSDLRLRTNSDAAQPLADLVAGSDREQRALTFTDIEQAAMETLLRALRRDPHQLDRIDLLPWRRLVHRRRWPDLHKILDVRQQRHRYLDLWAEVITRLGRRTLPPVYLPRATTPEAARLKAARQALEELIEALGALEDGYLGLAIGATAPQQEIYARRFGRCAAAIVEAVTTPG